MKNIGSRLKHIRNVFSLTQPAFAKAIGVSSGNVSDWEHGRSNPGAQALVAISNQFQVSVDWILKGTSPGPGEPYPQLSTESVLRPHEQKILNMLQGMDNETLSMTSELIKIMLARETLTSILKFDDEEMLQVSKYILFLKEGRYQSLNPHANENPTHS